MRGHSSSKRAALGAAILPALAVLSCGDPLVVPEEDNGTAIAQLQETAHHGTLVEVIAVHTADGPRFRFSTHEVPSGWTTFRFVNASDQTHFAVLEKLPEGGTFESAVNEVVPAFQELMDLIIEEGLTPLEAFLAVIGDLPAWFLESGYTFLGGPGLAASGRAHEVTVNLEPGTYVVECYVKTTEGKFHSFLGMIEKLVVTDAPSGAAEPARATTQLIISNSGFDAPGDLSRPGLHTVAVDFAEQQVHGNFVQSDVHLVKLNDGADLSGLNAWINWAEPAGLSTPAPATFVGGIQDMRAGETGYVTVFLAPGRYAWIAEVDDPNSKGMLKTFMVPSMGG